MSALCHFRTHALQKNVKRRYFHNSSTFSWHGRASVKKKEAQPEAGLRLNDLPAGFL
jgi:hypothetical protein